MNRIACESSRTRPEPIPDPMGSVGLLDGSTHSSSLRSVPREEMMTAITKEQAGALAALVAALRPGWDAPGVMKALADARDRGSAWQLAHAALHAAEAQTNRTPAIIAMTGEHWTKGRALGEANPIHYDRCPIDGHTSYPANNCGYCRAEQIEATPGEVKADPEATERNRAGRELVRAALRKGK